MTTRAPWAPMIDGPAVLRNDPEFNTCMHGYPAAECRGDGPSAVFAHLGGDFGSGLDEGLRLGTSFPRLDVLLRLRRAFPLPWWLKAWRRAEAWLER
jgi:hypothetical protein